MNHHSALNRGLMFEWLQDCFDSGTAIPTDAEIMERFDFSSPEASRTLLADLADRGMISIRGVGEDRTIMMGRQRQTFASAPAPIRTVKRPVSKLGDLAVEDGIARLAEILQRKPASAAPAKIPPVVPAAKAVQTPASTVRAAKPTPPPEVPTQTAPAQGQRQWAGKRQPAASLKGNKRQLNLTFSEDAFEQLEASAAAAGRRPGAHATAVILQHLAGSNAPVGGGKKPKVCAAIVAAAAAEGIELYVFLTQLLDLGFQHYDSTEPAA